MRVKMATSYGARARGLLLRDASWLGDDGVLILSPCKSVHTFGMRQRIDIAFVGRDGTILRSERSVAPMRTMSRAGSVAVIERFSTGGRDADGGMEDRWFEPGDVVELSLSLVGDSKSFVLDKPCSIAKRGK